MLLIPFDQRTVAIVAQAMREGFTITGCPLCGHSVVHSKTKPLARCLGCGERKQTEKTEKTRRQRCRRCKKPFYSKFAFLYCEPCRDFRKRHPGYESEPSAPTVITKTVIPQNPA